jgi:hypothetical protein
MEVAFGDCRRDACCASAMPTSRIAVSLSR